MPLISVWECPCCNSLVKRKKNYIRHLKQHAKQRMNHRKILKSAEKPIEIFTSLVKGMSLTNFVFWSANNVEVIERLGHGLDNIGMGKPFNVSDYDPVDYTGKLVYVNSPHGHTLSMRKGGNNKSKKVSKAPYRIIDQGDYEIMIGSVKRSYVWYVKSHNEAIISTMKLLADETR